ncbi:uncharacterized protein LOC101236332 [Hydra vulgaris]|uniref:uncharacterized protein LOC101236332 n=1 Tax=Hydra vulgaris TaxID=6087 RepID=UPI0002B411EF|nr:uncharacterized protein LOC101236332 [Hydra vulgaris]
MIWYEPLLQINIANRYFQYEKLDLQLAMQYINNCKVALNVLRNNFDSLLLQAQRITASCEIDTELPQPQMRKKKQSLYELAEQTQFTQLENLQINFFNETIEVAIHGLDERFTKQNHLCGTFGFLFNIKSVDKEGLRTSCEELKTKLDRKRRSDKKSCG